MRRLVGLAAAGCALSAAVAAGLVVGTASARPSAAGPVATKSQIVVNRFGTANVAVLSANSSQDVVSATAQQRATARQKYARFFAREGEARRHGGGGSSGYFPPSPLPPPRVAATRISKTNPELSRTFAGINALNASLAAGGLGVTAEPPDQALCVGNGHVVEAVNTNVRMFSTSGAAETAPIDLNAFYGYLPVTDPDGPFLTDPICHFDPATGRFFLVVLTLEFGGGDFTGPNHLDLAVSNTGDPRGAWTLYKLPVQNDGTEGTPDHNCDAGACIGDYPHIGADRNGIYLTTNEYAFFGDSYSGAQLYAFDKFAFAALPASITARVFENLKSSGIPGFTVWPAISPAGQESTANGGTEYFMSTIAGDGSETGNPSRSARHIAVWSLTGTSTLAKPSPQLDLNVKLIRSEDYVFPPEQESKDGPRPLGECLSGVTLPGCWSVLGWPFDPGPQGAPEIDAGDGRMQQVWFAAGRLFGAAGTAVNVAGEVKAGIAWFVVRVGKGDKGGGKDSSPEPEISDQGYLAVAGNHVTYPAIATDARGHGVMAFTLMGDDFFPTAAYARLGKSHVGRVHVTSPGLGPIDGFGSYAPFGGPSRWGDYGAAVISPDGGSIWIASESVEQSCTFADFANDLTCGATRDPFENWGTRISQVTLRGDDD